MKTFFIINSLFNILGSLTGSSCPQRQQIIFGDTKLHGRLETTHKHVFHGTNEELCRIRCIQMFECNSYSINSAKQICEVYTVTKDVQGITFINNLEWIYHIKKVLVVILVGFCFSQ